jgi:hypothetical protein
MIFNFGTATNSNVKILRRSKILRIITNAVWYVTNDTLHRDLKISSIKETVKKLCQRYRDRLEKQITPLKATNESKRNSEKIQEEGM